MNKLDGFIIGIDRVTCNNHLQIMLISGIHSHDICIIYLSLPKKCFIHNSVLIYSILVCILINYNRSNIINVYE